MTNKKILLGLTTTPDSDWREKVKEINKLGLKEVALFPTFLKTDERKELYELLEQTELQSIPHVHIRGEDMDLEEIAYLFEKYNVEVFNTHSTQDYPMNFDYSKYKIYLENTNSIPPEEELKKYDGLCIDFAHWENNIQKKNAAYDNFEDLIKRYSVGCCHISAVSRESSCAKHFFNNYEEFNYLKKYLKYIPRIISLELENSFTEQLKVKEYLEKIINNK